MKEKSKQSEKAPTVEKVLQKVIIDALCIQTVKGICSRNKFSYVTR